MTEMNTDIRAATKAAGVKLWMVAARLGLTDSAFSRKLRFELPTEEKQRILEIIEDLKGTA